MGRCRFGCFLEPIQSLGRSGKFNGGVVQDENILLFGLNIFLVFHSTRRLAHSSGFALLAAVGAPPVTRTLSFKAAYRIGAACETLWPLLRAGGRMLYCTCSVFKAEGESQIQTFVQHNTDALILPSPGHLTPSGATSDTSLRDNGMGEHDGFYYALLEKDRD